MFGSAVGAFGHDFSKQPSPLRRWIMTKGTAFGCRYSMLMYGVVWISKKKVIVDYSKWLGADWKFNAETSYKGAGTFVANH
jgi:hypothetical protein